VFCFTVAVTDCGRLVFLGDFDALVAETNEMSSI